MPDPASPPGGIERTPRQVWALPGSKHDWIVKGARVVLPSVIGVLLVALTAAPLLSTAEVSFVLAKDNVAIAKERLRVNEALYRGEDSKGQAFSLRAGSAVQITSRDPVVRLNDLQAQIELKEGPATMVAEAGRYDMDREVVQVDGPITFATSDGYRLQTRDVAVGLKTRKVASGGPVTGNMPLGSFAAGRIQADLNTRTVVLDGRARLHIVQGAAR